jgi:dGTPase
MSSWSPKCPEPSAGFSVSTRTCLRQLLWGTTSGIRLLVTMGSVSCPSCAEEPVSGIFSTMFRESERKGRGWNLTLQVLDGILCHNGEIHTPSLSPDRGKTFERMDREMRDQEKDPTRDIPPMTLEGCVVRMADTISYVGRDIEDAIRLGLITRGEIPDPCRQVLGDTNGTIVYSLVEDLVSTSLGKDCVAFSEEVSGALAQLRTFNHERIYMNERVKKQTPKIKIMFQLLFDKYLQDLETGNRDSDIDKEFLAGMSPAYRDLTSKAAVVRDFIAGMTDEYFLTQCHKHLIPQWISTGL